MKKIIIITMLAFVALSCAKQSVPDFSKDVHLQIATALDRSGDVFQALIELGAAKKAGEDENKIRQYLKSIEERKVKATATLVDLNIGLKNKMQERRYHRYYYQSGICYELLGQNQKALFSFTKSITLRAQPIVYVQRGILFSHLNQKRAAFADFKKALELDAKYPRALLHLGLYYVKNAQPKKAIEITTRIKDSHPLYYAIIIYYLNQVKKK